jgi:outer membrane cobalamin receptor
LLFWPSLSSHHKNQFRPFTGVLREVWLAVTRKIASGCKDAEPGPTIPITPVQSIDILKDGVSTTYGSDAIAGVVNFNFYKDYRGARGTTSTITWAGSGR